MKYIAGTLVQHKRERISYKNRKSRQIPKEDRIAIPHCHSAIIDRQTWEIVSSRFRDNNRVKPLLNGEISLFSQKIKCDCCSHAFYKNGRKGKIRAEYVYWICSKNYGTAVLLCNNKKSVKEDELSEFVLKEINNQIKIYYDKVLIEKNYYSEKVSSSIEEDIEKLNKETGELKAKILKKENTLIALYEDRVSGVISMQEFLIIKDKNTIDIEGYKIRIKQIDNEIASLNKKKLMKIDTEKTLKKYEKLESLNRKIIDEFISRIYVGYYNEETNTRKIKIEWNVDV